MAATRARRKPKVKKPAARLRAEVPKKPKKKTKRQLEQEHQARLEARRQRRAELKAEREREARRERRAELKAEREREAKREARRQRRAELKAEREREARREREREARDRAKRERAEAEARERFALERAALERAEVEEAEQREDRERREVLRRRRSEQRRKQRREKRRRQREGREGLPRREEPPEPHEVREEHPLATEASLVLAEQVHDRLKSDLRLVWEYIGTGHYRTYLYPETGDMDGYVWREAVLSDSGTTLGNMGDAFQILIDNPWYGEMFFQGVVKYVVGESDTIRIRSKKGSPLDDSRVGSDGKHYRTAVTNWFKGHAQGAINTSRSVIINVSNREPDFVLVHVGIRVYWSPVERRPERTRHRRKDKK